MARSMRRFRATRRRPPQRPARGVLLAAAALALACGSESPPEVDAVRIVAPDFRAAQSPTPAVSGTLWENGEAREIHLRSPRKRIAGPPWREFALRQAGGGPPADRLLLGPGAAALHYHLASRDPVLPRSALRPNRLVVLEAGDETRLGLLIERGARDPNAQFASLAELSPEAGARIVALAQALGAWAVVANDRYPLAADGHPFLPFFVPRAGGDWRALAGRSLDAFLPPALGRHFARTPGFRRLQYRHLADFSRRLPALAAAAERFAASPQAPDLGDEIAALRALLSESFEAYQGYLDSAWIEMSVRVRPPDAASVRIDVYSVSEVTLDAFLVQMPRKRLVVGNEALSALRLSADGASVPARLGQDRLEFPLGVSVEPRPRGPYAFEGVRLDFELEGLAPLGENFWPLLDDLRLQATNRSTGAIVPDEHVKKIVSLEDPRFAIGREADVDDFLASLGHVLDRTGAGADRPLLDVDRSTGAFVLREGVYVVKEDLILPAGHGLLVEAGVELRVRPGKSLLVRGPLEVRGTERRPVRVRGMSNAEPWGVLAVQGKGRSVLGGARPRCEIRHLELSGGSEDYLKGVFYSGQLSVYHEDLVLEHVTLRRAFGDDALNTKYGAVEIRDSVFIDNAFDGVDLDWSDGVVERCFLGMNGPGGDGLDLSGSRVSVEDSVFSDVPDKCLSVGEAATLTLRGSLLRACKVGVASKDRSLADVRESVFLDNGRNFAAYQKKPVFGGGRIRGEDLVLIGTAKPDLRDGPSEIAVEGARTFADGMGGELDIEALRKTSAFSRERFRALGTPGR
jgi:hypothetical protein